MPGLLPLHLAVAAGVTIITVPALPGFYFAATITLEAIYKNVRLSLDGHS